MAETETAVLEPTAETVDATEQEPLGETEVLSETETGAETDPETETFSKEQVEERVKAAAEEARREAQETLEEVRRTAEQQEAEKYWNEDVYREGMRFFRNVAAFGAKQASEKGVTPDEAAQMVQAIHVKQFLDEFATKVKPVITGEVHRTHLGEMQKIIKARYPEWKSKDADDKFDEANKSNKADVALRGLVDYLTAAHDQSKTQAAVAAELEKQKKAQDVAKLQKTGSNSGPAKIGGTSASKADPTAIISDPNATDAQRRAAFEKAYGFKPNF